MWPTNITFLEVGLTSDLVNLHLRCGNEFSISLGMVKNYQDQLIFRIGERHRRVHYQYQYKRKTSVLKNKCNFSGNIFLFFFGFVEKSWCPNVKTFWIRIWKFERFHLFFAWFHHMTTFTFICFLHWHWYDGLIWDAVIYWLPATGNLGTLIGC